jgi:anti-sigma factor RsiW
MSCQAAAESLVALLDGEIGPQERRALEQHLTGCAACARELEELRATRRLLDRGLAGVAPERGAGSFEALWQRIEADEHPTLRLASGGAGTRRIPRRRAVWLGAGGLALAASLALVVLGIQQQPAPEVAPARPVVAGGPPAVAAKSGPRVASRVAAEPRAKQPQAREASQLAQRAPEDAAASKQVAAVANEVDDPPRELLERPELFVNYPVVRRLDELRHFDAVLASQGERGDAG